MTERHKERATKRKGKSCSDYKQSRGASKQKEGEGPVSVIEERGKKEK